MFRNLKKPEAFLQQHDQKNTRYRRSRAADKEISLRDVKKKKKPLNFSRKGGRTEEEETMPKQSRFCCKNKSTASVPPNPNIQIRGHKSAASPSCNLRDANSGGKPSLSAAGLLLSKHTYRSQTLTGSPSEVRDFLPFSPRSSRLKGFFLGARLRIPPGVHPAPQRLLRLGK